MRASFAAFLIGLLLMASSATIYNSTDISPEGNAGVVWGDDWNFCGIEVIGTPGVYCELDWEQ